MTKYKMTYKCDRCKKEFLHKRDYKKHLNRKNLCHVVNDTSNEKKYHCDICKYKCGTLNELERHFKLECVPNARYTNIYDLDPNTLGKKIYRANESGDLYIVQNNFVNNKYMKVGKSGNVIGRISSYRTGLAYEPRLHYYYPVRNADKAEKLVHRALLDYKHRGEIFEVDLDTLRRIIKDTLKKNFKDDVLEYKPNIKYGDVHECCDEIFKTKQEYVEHMVVCAKNEFIKVNSDNKKLCLACNKYFSKSNFSKHVKTCQLNEINRKKIYSEIKDKVVFEMKEKIDKLSSKIIELSKTTRPQLNAFKSDSITQVTDDQIYQ